MEGMQARFHRIGGRLAVAVNQGQVKVAEMLRAAGAQEPAPALRAQDV